VASSLFGLVNETILNYGGFSGVRYKDFSFYAQDSYKLRPRLTLNYGLRYDIDLPATEAFNRFRRLTQRLLTRGGKHPRGLHLFRNGYRAQRTEASTGRLQEGVWP